VPTAAEMMIVGVSGVLRITARVVPRAARTAVLQKRSPRTAGMTSSAAGSLPYACFRELHKRKCTEVVYVRTLSTQIGSV
jgi:hypothetical protein